MSAKELKQAATDGTLQPTDLVWTDGMAEWKEARTVKGLEGQWPVPTTRRMAQTDPVRPAVAGRRVGQARDGISLPAKLGLAGAGAFALMVLVCCGGLAVISVGKGGRTTDDPLVESRESAAISVDATRLFADYEANEVSADEKYKGKVLEVSGVVDSIGRDLFDTIYVTLMVGGRFQIMKVQCFFGDECKAEAAKLAKGQRIVVRGRCDGKSLNVVVKDCIFVSPK